MGNPKKKQKESPQAAPSFTFQGQIQGAVFNLGTQAGITSTGANAVIHQEPGSRWEPAEVLQLLTQLQSLLAEARRGGADVAHCDAGEKAAQEIAAAAQNPRDPQAQEQAHGAMAILEKTAKALGGFADIGGRFQTLLTMLTPALASLMQRVA
jgi:hypothetical protein